MKYSDYRLQDAAQAHALLQDDDFIQAFCSAMGLLGHCLAEHPCRGAAVCACQIRAIRAMDVAEDWPFGTDDQRAHAAGLLAQGACEDDDALERAFAALLRGPGRLPAAPWSSVYTDHDQVLYGETWLELREWMRRNGVGCTYAEKEPEDQIGRLMAMAGLVARSKPELLCELLGEFLYPWTDRFFELFVPAAREASPTYGAIAELAEATLADVRGLLGVVPARRRLYR